MSDEDDDNDDKDDGHFSEEEWMEIESSESEGEMSILKKAQKQPKKIVKFKDIQTEDPKDSVPDNEIIDEAKNKDTKDDDLELLTVSSPPPADKPKKKVTSKQPKQNKGTSKTTTIQKTLFDAGVKLKAGVKRKTSTNADQGESSRLPKKPVKQLTKSKVT